MNPWHEIVSIARFAPSPHNTQPWKLDPIDESRAKLFMVRSRMLPDEDTTGAFLDCAMGIFIESLRIIAANRGLELHCEPILNHECSNGLIPFADLTLSRTSPQRIYSDELFMKRRTSRLRPFGKLVDAGVLSEAHACAESFGYRLTVVDDQREIDAILERNINAVFHDLNMESYGNEIRRWFRYGYRHELKTRDGLSSRCMNMTAAELFCSAAFPGLMSNGLTRRMMQRVYRWRLGTAFQLGMLSGPFWSRNSSENAGRALINIWLTLTRHDAFIHPFGNLVTNREAHLWLTQRVNVEGIWIVFRLGHTAPPPQSLRLSTEELMC